jgi:hypothetical protein
MVVGSGGAAHLKPVTVGIRGVKRVQILSGLSPTDVVIDSGSYGLDDGTKVHVAPPEEGDAGKGAAGQDGQDGGQS